MKRVFIIVACFAAVACVGSGTKNDKSVSQTMDGGATVRDERGHDELEHSVAWTTAENYQEMAMSAIENGDSETFMLAMEQMNNWYEGLDASDRSEADKAIEAWNEANKERKDANFERALTMPRMTSAEAKALSKR